MEKVNLFIILVISLVFQNFLTLNVFAMSGAEFDPEQLISLAKNLKSIKVQTENLEDLKNIEGVVLVGSSGAGKTTLLNEIRAKCKNVSIPKRFITRPARLNEDDQENIHVDKTLFEQKVREGEIACSWEREMEGGRTEYYGFEAISGNFPIYSANNSFLCSEKNANTSNYLIIGVYAPKSIRKARLISRSPDLSPGELKVRVKDPYKNALNRTHVLVHNHGGFEKRTSKFDLVTLIKALMKINSGWGKIKDLGNYEVEYHTRLFDIMTHKVEFSDGIQKTFQYARRSPGVRVLVRQDSNFLINAEWRTEINGWDFRLPGGKFFEEIGDYTKFLETHGKESLLEKGKESALTEIEEECGITLPYENLTYLTTSKCGATVDWDLFYYLADFTDKTEIFSHASPEGERTLSLWVNSDDVLNLCLTGSINEDRTAAVLMRFILNSKKCY